MTILGKYGANGVAGQNGGGYGVAGQSGSGGAAFYGGDRFSFAYVGNGGHGGAGGNGGIGVVLEGNATVSAAILGGDGGGRGHGGHGGYGTYSDYPTNTFPYGFVYGPGYYWDAPATPAADAARA